MSFSLTDTALHTPGISAGQTLVLAAIATFADMSGKAWPSIQAIAKITKQSIRTVQTHIASLLKLGFLKRIYRSGRSAITYITIRVTGVLTPVQTPATVAPAPPQLSHPEPAIESINQKTAQSQIDSIAAAAVIVVYESPAIPDIQQPAPTEPVLPSAPVMPLPAPVQTADPFADVPVQLIVDFGIIRKNKKKPAQITGTEAKVFAEQASIAGLTPAQAMFECVTRGWSRFNASWLPAKPTEATSSVFVPETVQPVTQEIKSAGLADLTALRSTIGASTDPLKWARDAIARDARGERVGYARLRNARMALRI